MHLWDPELPRSSIHVNRGIITSGIGRVSFHLASPGPHLQSDQVRCNMLSCSCIQVDIHQARVNLFLPQILLSLAHAQPRRVLVSS